MSFCAAEEVSIEIDGPTASDNPDAFPDSEALQLSHKFFTIDSDLSLWSSQAIACRLKKFRRITARMKRPFLSGSFAIIIFIF
jgi:hypothetical protein